MRMKSDGLPEETLPLVLSLRQAAKQLGIGVRTLARLRARRELPTVRLGPRRLGISREVLCELIEKGGVA